MVLSLVLHTVDTAVLGNTCHNYDKLLYLKSRHKATQKKKKKNSKPCQWNVANVFLNASSAIILSNTHYVELLQTPARVWWRRQGRLLQKMYIIFMNQWQFFGGFILEKSKSKSGVHCVSRLSVPRPLTLVSEVLPYGRELVVGQRFKERAPTRMSKSSAFSGGKWRPRFHFLPCTN